MGSARLTCGRCGHAACICPKAVSTTVPREYAPFGIYGGDQPTIKKDFGRGSGDFTGRFRSEIDGLQAGVNYLDTFSRSTNETPLRQVHRKSLKKLLELEKQSQNLGTNLERRRLEALLAKSDLDTPLTPPLAVLPRSPSSQKYTVHHSHSYDPCDPHFSLDDTPPFFVEDNVDSWEFQFDGGVKLNWLESEVLFDDGDGCNRADAEVHSDDGFGSNRTESEAQWLDCVWDEHFFPTHTTSQEHSTGATNEFVPPHSHEEKCYTDQQYTRSKESPTVYQTPSEEITGLEIDEKAPQVSQWATLQELRESSKRHYIKFITLTSKINSRGIKMLRRMYGGPKGMLDSGITTFGDVLDGQEPQSLKEIFAFTCLSYVMSKLLQKHGRMDGSRVLADTDRWRLAIKKEKDRLVYDHIVTILWPEIAFLKGYSKEEYTKQTPPPTESHSYNIVPLDLALSGHLYSATSSNIGFLNKAQDADCSSIEDDMESTYQYPDDCLDPNGQPQDHGLHSHLLGLLYQTSTHEDFMFADFLKFCGSQLENNIGAETEIQPPIIVPIRYSPVLPPQLLPPIEPVTLDPEKLRNSSSSIAGSKVLFQTESWSPKADEVPTVLPTLGSLIETIVFQVVVEFMKFITSLGDLLFRLSGCGITSRRKKHEAKGFTRPVQQFGEFVAGAQKLVLEPIREDLGEVDESVDAVLFMADDFVRLGRLHTVREIEEYIITTARYLVCDYASFTTIVSKTLNRCLAASDQMTWDHIYPNYVDQEDYSANYVKRTESAEIEWALQNFKNEDHGENNVNLTTSNVVETGKSTTPQPQRSSSCNPDPVPAKKQKLSILSPNSSNERQSSRTPVSSSDGDLFTPSKMHCHYSKCKSSYTGKDARVNLRRHIRTIHEGCKAIKCPKCGHESPRRDNVRKHFLSQHKGEKVPAVLICKTRA